MQAPKAQEVLDTVVGFLKDKLPGALGDQVENLPSGKGEQATDIVSGLGGMLGGK